MVRTQQVGKLGRCLPCLISENGRATVIQRTMAMTTDRGRPAMSTITTENPLAVAAVQAIRAGDVAALKQLVTDNPGLASVRLRDKGMSRTLLHVVTDWPGHFPN